MALDVPEEMGEDVWVEEMDGDGEGEGDEVVLSESSDDRVAEGTVEVVPFRLPEWVTLGE